MENMYGTDIPRQASGLHVVTGFIRPTTRFEEVPFGLLLGFWASLILAPLYWGPTVYTGAISATAAMLTVLWVVSGLSDPLPAQED